MYLRAFICGQQHKGHKKVQKVLSAALRKCSRRSVVSKNVIAKKSEEELKFELELALINIKTIEILLEIGSRNVRHRRISATSGNIIKLASMLNHQMEMMMSNLFGHAELVCLQQDLNLASK